MSRPVRVLHLTHDMGIGGTEQVIRQLILGLDTSLVASRVLCLDGQVGAIGRQLQTQGVPVSCLHRRPGFDRALISAIREKLQSEPVDVLHCHQYTPYSYGVLAALFTGVRVVYTEHGRFHPDRYSWKRRLVNPLLNLATDAVTAISAATREALIHFEWFPPRSVEVIYNGLHDDATDACLDSEARPGDGQAGIVFGTVARLDVIKNHRMLLDAFAEVLGLHPDAHLLMVGDGPERQALEHQAQTLGIATAVTFTGFQSDTAHYLRQMDVFVLSSFSEGTSMTLLEAMSCCRPCLATAVGGNVELLEHARSGWLTASADTAALVAAMHTLAADAGLRATLGHTARRVFLERFEAGHMIAAYQRLYLGQPARNLPGRSPSEARPSGQGSQR